MLDFTALNNIGTERAREAHTATLTPTEENLALKPQKAGTGQNKSPFPRILSREKEERQNAREMYATYQQNITRAGELRSDILKGIHRGEPLADLLLKALECIGNMTGDTVIHEQGKREILAIYGWGLGDPAPLQLELEETKKRLARLEDPETKAHTADLELIRTAIKAHKEKITDLEQAIAKSQEPEKENL